MKDPVDWRVIFAIVFMGMIILLFIEWVYLTIIYAIDIYGWIKSHGWIKLK